MKIMAECDWSQDETLHPGVLYKLKEAMCLGAGKWSFQTFGTCRLSGAELQPGSHHLEVMNGTSVILSGGFVLFRGMQTQQPIPVGPDIPDLPEPEPDLFAVIDDYMRAKGYVQATDEVADDDSEEWEGDEFPLDEDQVGLFDDDIPDEEEFGSGEELRETGPTSGELGDAGDDSERDSPVDSLDDGAGDDSSAAVDEHTKTPPAERV